MHQVHLVIIINWNSKDSYISKCKIASLSPPGLVCLEMVKHPQTYPLIPKIPLGWSIKSKFWRIFKCTFMHVKYVVQRFVPRDLILWIFQLGEKMFQKASKGCSSKWKGESEPKIQCLGFRTLLTNAVSGPIPFCPPNPRKGGSI